MKGTIKALFVSITLLICTASWAAVDVIEFENDADRKRYQELAAELRCPKCPNQNLVGTDSGIAYDLRREVARLIKEGQTNKQIKAYMVNRYGDFVLYKPPVNNKTLILWWGPGLMLLMGVIVFGVIVLQRRRNIATDKEQPEDLDQD
ncbi:cytochrome c-type biogenesis protein [Saccharophagus degradans]|uniref:Cytochrome c-type biogenesis protein n=1 Tax=Saccharophagus degradans TaxID=86304 RepID=A0AAW7X4K2_9GAMM|nr:cytochrome c-type biogenesis protein [Saccharophagus degradans]MDO6421309.1 cytochrome c-type biogenesis protein CcmH [Saccharophagus degradans]MDO6605780.1 cytochrome c-type biogenesis protein CcmH [Saccharophagus degradans]WGO96617.1 cytochrome c-type biogenesis protein CcmH [Saccharophagus degradans]